MEKFVTGNQSISEGYFSNTAEKYLYS